jgi:hypothetical protein
LKKDIVNKLWLGSSNIPGEVIYINVSSNKERNLGGTKFWVVVVDDYSDYCWSIFLKNKSDLKTKIINLLKDLIF